MNVELRNMFDKKMEIGWGGRLSVMYRADGRRPSFILNKDWFPYSQYMKLIVPYIFSRLLPGRQYRIP